MGLARELARLRPNASGQLPSANIEDSAITSAKLSSTSVTDKLGYTPTNKLSSVNLTFGKTGGKTFTDLIFYQFSGTINPNQVAFYASTAAEARMVANYVVQAFVNDIKNLENDRMFDQDRAGRWVNSGFTGYLPSSIPSGVVDCDESAGGEGTGFQGTDYFRLVVASNGVDKLWTTGVLKGNLVQSNDIYSVFRYQKTAGETGYPSISVNNLNAGQDVTEVYQVTESSSFTGATNGDIGVAPFPVTVALNF
jgi:hypothetical protein